MTISNIKKLLASSTHPIARVLFAKEGFKVLAIEFLKDMILKDHKTPYESKLVVIQGSVVYKQDELETILLQYEEYIIASNELHSVRALEDSICLLIQA